MENEKSEILVGGKLNSFLLPNNQNDPNLTNKLNLNNIQEKEEEIKSSVNSQLKFEIASLKDYINKMNIQIRKNLNLEIQLSIEEGFNHLSQQIKNGKKDQKSLQDLITVWMNKIFDMNYINPLITLYENYIKTLEEEIKNLSNINKKNETLIMKLVGENNELRNQVLATEEEMKNFLEIRAEISDGSSIVVMDREHIRKIEERNKLLSKENEILVVNYNKLQDELFKLKNENQMLGIEDNNMKYQKLNKEFIKMKNYNEELIGQQEVLNKKIMDISNSNNIISLDNQKLKETMNKMNFELNAYKEAYEKYEKNENNLKNDE